MRRLVFVFIATALAACASTSPRTVVESGRLHEFTSSRAPKALAECTAINARSFSGNYTSSVGEMIRPDNYQVVVAEVRTFYHPIIVGRAVPTPDGSQLVLFTSSALDTVDTNDWIARLRKGC